MQLRNTFLMLLLLLSIIAKPQSITKKEVNGLHDILQARFMRVGYGFGKHTFAPSQTFLLILETDSVGKVRGIHCLADNKNPDTAYVLLNNLTATDFEKWKGANCSNKIIILPVVILAPDPYRNYIDDIFDGVLWKRQRKTPPMQDGKVILVETYIYAVVEREGCSLTTPSMK